MPSKRKNQRREDELLEDGWFALSADLWLEQGEIPRKVRLVADTNFPAGLVEALEKAKLSIATARSLGLERLADGALLAQAMARGRVLITLDRDFWCDEKFPLHSPEA
jgi:hypothetical protein